MKEESKTSNYVQIDDSTTSSTTFTYYYVGCPYRNLCSDEGKKCDSCVHSGKKKSYYEPYPEPYIPCQPYPWYPPYYVYPYLYYPYDVGTATYDNDIPVTHTC